MRLVSIMLLTVPLLSAAQKKELFGVHIGGSGTNIVFKEAISSTVNFLGFSFNTGKTFAASGFQAGLSKQLTARMFGKTTFTYFSSNHDLQVRVNEDELTYSMNGFQVPAIVSWYFRDTSKRLNMMAGAGVQLIHAHLQQYHETDQSISRNSDITITELQLCMEPGVQFRIVRRLYALFTVTIGVSANGRYSDHPCFSLKYMFS